MVNENVLTKFGFVKEENDIRLKEMIRTSNKLKEIHIDVYPENPLISSNPFLLLLRTTENNAIIAIDGDRLILKRNDKHETHFMNVLIPKITECFSKICVNYSEFILNVQNVYYKITVFKWQNYMIRWDFMNAIKLSDIKVTDDFLQSRPSERKIEKAIRYYGCNGILDKPVVLFDGEIVDNYTRYLAAKIIGLEEVPYVELQKMSYIVGRFDGNKKWYIWKNDGEIDINIGDSVMVKVKNKYGKTKKVIVTVKDLFQYNGLDLYNKHRSVVLNLNKK